MKKIFSMLPFLFVLPLPIFTQEVDFKEAVEKCFKKPQTYLIPTEEQKQCLIGLTAPNFQAISITKEKIELNKLRGKVVVLYFWYVSCGDACLRQLPGLNEVAKRYRFQDVHFLALADDEEATILEEFLPQYEFWFKIIPNAQTIISDTFQHRLGFPAWMVLDKNGKITLIDVGGKTSKEVIENLIPAIEAAMQ